MGSAARVSTILEWARFKNFYTNCSLSLLPITSAAL